MNSYYGACLFMKRSIFQLVMDSKSSPSTLAIELHFVSVQNIFISFGFISAVTLILSNSTSTSCHAGFDARIHMYGLDQELY